MKSELMMSPSEITRILGTVGSPLIVITELIKNAFDESANHILIQYDTNNRKIIVHDDGTGFTKEDIENLSKPGLSKKKGSSQRNKNGLYFTGSKGLGILSSFSLCKQVQIDSHNGTTHILAQIYGESGEYDFQIIDSENDEIRTIITLSDVKIEDIDLLSSESELKKLRHISTYLYRRNDVFFPNIALQIGESEPMNILTDIEFAKMTYDVQFEYDRKNTELTFQCLSDNISGKKISIKSFDLNSIEKVVLAEYGIKNTIRTRTNDNLTTQALEDLNRVPSFEGRMLIFEKKFAGAALKEYGAGVNIYVNEFALYNYLSEENDWLGLADFSQRKKNTRVRPHNAFGYVNFPEYDESMEELKISNERADFLQNPVFYKLMYLLKGVVMFILFNIDVAEKNPQYKRNEEEKDKEDANETEQTESSNSSCDNEAEDDSNIDSSNQNGDKASNDAQDSYNDKGNKQTDDPYLPESMYKPKQFFPQRLQFTLSDSEFIKTLKNTDDLSNKIYQIIFEFSTLDIQKQRYAAAFLYRALLESATKYVAKKYPTKIVINKDDLQGSIVSALNHFANLYKSDDDIKKKIPIWREAVTKRNLALILNQYIHDDTAVDTDFILQTWNSMKPYIMLCIKSI